MSARATPSACVIAECRRRVLRIVRPGSDGASAIGRIAPSASRSMPLIAPHIGGALAGHGDTSCRLRTQPLCQRPRIGIVHADDSQIPRRLPIKHGVLGGDVTRHVAMTIEMIRAEIQHHRGIEAERGESLQHIGRHFENVATVVRQQFQRQRRRCRDCRPPPPAARPSSEYAPVNAVVVDLPLVPVMPTKRAAIPPAAPRGTAVPHPTGSARPTRARARPPDAASAA